MHIITVVLLSVAIGLCSAQFQMNLIVINKTSGLETCPSASARAAARASARATVLSALPCGGVAWTRVIFINMSDPAMPCPAPLGLTNIPIRSCFLVGNTGCRGPSFPTGRTYSRVCGRIFGYGVRTPDAFAGSDESIDGAYCDGVSLTYGSPRQHIWTFAGGHGSDFGPQNIRCPCGNTNRQQAPLPPAFVGENYFCDTRDNVQPFWDGEGCNEPSCCLHGGPPTFNMALPSPTSADLEVRICADTPGGDENIHVSFIEIFVL